MTPALSVVTMCIRPGGIDLLFKSLTAQEFTDYELIIVDGWPGRIERGLVTAFADRLGLPKPIHVPPKPRSIPDTVTGLCNAMNTGAMHASAPLVLFLHDFSWLPPGTLRRWMDLMAVVGPRTMVSGIADMYGADPHPMTQEDLSVWDREVQFFFKWHWVPEVFENFHTLIPVSFFEESNGIDEMSDYCIAWAVRTLIAQAQLAGWKLMVSDGMVCGMIDHRTWRDDKGQIEWKITDGAKLPEEPVWVHPSRNTFDFKQLRRQALLARGIEL